MFGALRWRKPEPPLELTAKPELGFAAPPGALNDLFYNAGQYRHGPEFAELLRFVTRFHFYSPYNAMLIRIQKPGAIYVAPAKRWRDQFNHAVKPHARPIVILQPGGPVMYVFDVSDVYPLNGAKPLPKQITDPFEVTGTFDPKWLERLLHNMKRDGVMLVEASHGSHGAGSIQNHVNGQTQIYTSGRLFEKAVHIPVQFLMQINPQASQASQFSTVVHELAHLYCGHVGSPNRKWWPERVALAYEIVEFEAESVSYLVCKSLNLEPSSASYLSKFTERTASVPDINFDLIFKISELVLSMSRTFLKPRRVEVE